MTRGLEVSHEADRPGGGGVGTYWPAGFLNAADTVSLLSPHARAISAPLWHLPSASHRAQTSPRRSRGVSVVPAPSIRPIDTAGTWTAIAAGVRPTTVRSDPQPAIGRAVCRRARKPAIAAIMSPTVMRARMSVS